MGRPGLCSHACTRHPLDGDLAPSSHDVRPHQGSLHFFKPSSSSVNHEWSPLPQRVPEDWGDCERLEQRMLFAPNHVALQACCLAQLYELCRGRTSLTRPLAGGCG